MDYFNNITFANKEFLWLLLVLPVLLIWYLRTDNKNRPEMLFSSLEGDGRFAMSWRAVLRHILFVFRFFSIALIIIALARPQSSLNWQNITTEGIDIVLSMDISSSMLAADLKPNRLEASKDVAIKFVDSRINDRLGLVVFSGESFTQCPLTTDHNVLKNLFNDIKIGMIKDGTAIGMGLGTAINRLKESDAISKVIVLLTDGVNNQGEISPLTAAKLAVNENIRVYTIGVGSQGKAPYPVKDIFGNTQYQQVDVEIDEETLSQIAEMTNGKYFRATSKNALENIYGEIDKLEKSKVEVMEYSKKSEEYFLFALIGAILFLLETLLRYTIFRSIP